MGGAGKSGRAGLWGFCLLVPFFCSEAVGCGVRGRCGTKVVD